MRLLVVEDDQQTAWLLARGLKQYYAVDTVNNGSDGLFQAMQFGYDAVVLDIGLPDMPGTEVCRRMRDNGLDVPVLILTGQTGPLLVAKLLDLGADDYLAKPFQLEELRARLQAILRRAHANTSTNILTAGDLVLDPARRMAWRQDQPLALRRKEFDLLEYFMYNQSRTLTRAMIIEHVWDIGENVWGNVVDVHVKHLRDIIDRPYPEKLIKTVHGVGYKLEAKAGKAVVAI
ncbi:MAG TPA: response regulator transcription factor [Candidatus Saccharimonadales bacterium]|nr:response regulator transcription factor [Candidatus Saccharimonadales bacterium]